MLSELVLFGLLCLGAGFSQFAYVGGSPIINILFMLNIANPSILFIFISLKLTMPILYIILLGSSFVIAVRDGKKVSIVSGRYAMDYDLILIALPVSATGAIIGGLMKNMLADIIIVICAIALMIYLLCKGFRQNVTQFLSYQTPLYQQYLNNPLIQPPFATQLQPLQFGQQPKLKQSQYAQFTIPEQQQNPQLKMIINQQTNRLPKPKIKILIFILLYTILLIIGKESSSTELIVVNPKIDIPDDFIVDNVTQINSTNLKRLDGDLFGYLWKANLQNTQQQKSNDKNQSNYQRSRFAQKIRNYQDTDTYTPQLDNFVDTNEITSCVLASVIFIIIHIILSYLSSKSVAIQIATKDAQKQKHGFVFLKQTDKMSSKKMWNCIISGFFAGFLVGMFGIGGSIVLVPAWLNSGIDEQTAIISSTPITFFSALIALILTLFSNRNTFTFLIIFLILLLTIISALVSNWLGNRWTRNRDPKYLRNKIRKILYISSIIGLILYALPTYVFNKHFTEFGTFC